MDYLARYQITDEKLAGQLIDPEIRVTTVAQFGDWLMARADRLAIAANSFLTQLSGGL